MKINCKYCNSSNISKKGIRKLKKGKEQIYFCRNCLHKFSLNEDKTGNFKNEVIIDAINYYCLGYNSNEIIDIIKRKHKANVSGSSIYKWSKDYPYLKIKYDIIKTFGRNLIFSKVFKHSGLIYNFRFHKGKLLRFGKFNNLKKFIFDLEKNVDPNKFNSNRASQLKREVSVNIKHKENNFLNIFVNNILKSCNNNKKRHSIVEKFMLCCDRNTIAVEVPVWYWDKKINTGISGHIDVLQVKFGKIYILDFKPYASKENFDSVVSQLFHYARALSFRTNINLTNFKCSWFDWHDLYEFNPSEVKLND